MPVAFLRSALLRGLRSKRSRNLPDVVAPAFRTFWLGQVVVGNTLADLEGLRARPAAVDISRHGDLPSLTVFLDEGYSSSCPGGYLVSPVKPAIRNQEQSPAAASDRLASRRSGTGWCSGEGKRSDATTMAQATAPLLDSMRSNAGRLSRSFAPEIPASSNTATTGQPFRTQAV